MRKLFAISLLPFVISCSAENVLGEQEKIDQPMGETISLEVSLNQTTKTSLGEKTGAIYDVNWDAGDCISVNGRGSSALTEEQAGSSKATFKVTGVTAPYSIIYPVTATFGEGVILPKSQDFTEWGFDPATAIQVARSSSLAPQLHNVCSYLRITVCRKESEVVKQIKVISNDNKFLCGRFFVDYENNKLEYIEGGMNCVVMGRPEDDATVTIPYNDEGKCTAFIAIPSGTYPSGFTVVVSTDAGDNMSKKAHSKGITMVSGGVYPMEEIVFDDNAYRFSGGEGSESNPYIIATSDDVVFLFNMSNSSYSANYTGKHYKQICDISVENKYLTSAFREPDKAFTGVYDGGGHMIEYLSVKNYTSGEEKYACGLFAYTENATIRNLEIRYKFYRDNPKQLTGNYNGGFVGKMTGGLIENCTLSGNMHAAAPYVGGIVGCLKGGTISNCVVSSSVSGDAYITSSNYDNSYVGGIAGIVEDSGKVSDCTLSGHVRSVGSCAGGIVGQLSSGEIIDCNVDRAYVYGDKPRVGGIAGHINGAGCLIKNCLMSGIVFSQAGEVGGIVGYMRGGEISACKVLKPATVTGNGGSVGGVVGNIYSTVAANYVTINNNTVFASVSGTMNVGGIAGTVNSQGGTMKVINNAYGYQTITTTSSNSGSANMGGIVGIVTSTSTVPAKIANNASMFVKLINKASVANVSGIGGIVGNFAGQGEVACCWSDVMIGNIITASQTTSNIGSIVGNCALTTLPYCCYNENSTIKATNTPGKTYTGVPMSELSFTDGSLMAKLNSYAQEDAELNTWNSTVWTDLGRSYPMPDGIYPNEGQRTIKTKRISVIGDSISSFDGYNPEGYDAYYPTTTCRTFNVRDMYWYRLAYDYMSDAILDVNIAFSGSLVTYNGNEKNFPNRYIARKGMGNPDIILLFGGTNDYTASKVLYGSLKCDTATTAPSQSELNTVFATVDAATTMALAESLSDQTYFEAYVKLVKMMVLQYPKVKIVLIVGEHFSVGMLETIKAIAAHFPNNCRVVDFLSVNGLDGITNNPDWCPIGKCLDGGRNLHPNEAGMEFIANKIYTELGSWLEQ